VREARGDLTIGLIIAHLANPFYSAITNAVEKVARSHSTLLVTVTSEEDPYREREVFQELCRRKVDGLIVVPTFADHSFCEAEIEAGMPMVFVDRRPRGVEADTVLIDNATGAYEATRYLIARGHRRVGVIGQDLRLLPMEERLSGVRKALSEAGLELEESLLRFGPLSADDGAAAARSLLVSDNMPTAIFGFTNQLTVGIIEELQRSSAEVEVAGFDDIAVAELFSVAVTLVAYDGGSIGRRAAQMLFERVHGQQPPPSEVRIPTWLVSRGGAAAKRPSVVVTDAPSKRLDYNGSEQ
jgi:LacI family transcriptional regulator